MSHPKLGEDPLLAGGTVVEELDPIVCPTCHEAILVEYHHKLAVRESTTGAGGATTLVHEAWVNLIHGPGDALHAMVGENLRATMTPLQNTEEDARVLRMHVTVMMRNLLVTVHPEEASF